MYINTIVYIIIVPMGITIGWLIANYLHAQQKSKQLLEREEVMAELSAAKQQVAFGEHWRHECDILNNELRDLRNINSSLEADLREVNTRLESIRLHSEDKIRYIIDNNYHMNEQFENIANRIFEQNNRRIDEQNIQSLNGLLAPLREQLDRFHSQVQESFNHETRERYTLVHEIRSLQQLNAQITQETINLTNALKGNNKIQGNWGEMVLTRILEISGLRDGYEYETQVNIKTNTYSHMQPDVIVHLPHGKDVIIDAKTTLISYERYFNAQDDLARESAIQEHISSIRNHIRSLGRKDYQRLIGLQTLDYILMFIPIEPAFILALDRQPELLTEALKNNIMLVSPTTLLVALRTIVNFWRYENQSKNIQQIAERASKLYDKMRLFIDDISLIDQNLEKAQDNFHQAMKKLVSGRGNILAQIESFRSLGVEIKREINPELVEQAIMQDRKCHPMKE